MPPFQLYHLPASRLWSNRRWALARNDPFEQTAFSRRLVIELFGVAAQIATAEDVISHKLYWNLLPPSDRQLQDAAGVYAVQAGALDCFAQ
jgi:hypothetical protein